MRFSRDELHFLIKQYMFDNNIDYLTVTGSMSINKKKVILSISEDEGNDNHLNN